MPRTLLVVGCGSMGRRRIRHARELTDARVLGWDIRADRRREVRDLYGIETLERTEELAGLDIDGLFICVPPAEHEGYLTQAIERTTPYMVEQPISHRLDSLETLLTATRRARIPTHVSNNHRHSARVRLIRDLMTTGELGRPITGFVEIGEWLPDWHTFEPYTDYYPSFRAMGGGLDAVCDLDWLRDLFGEVEQAESFGARLTDLQIDTNDVQQFLFRFVGGPQVILHTDMVQRPFAMTLKLVFAGATITHRAPEQHLQLYRWSSGAWETIPFPEDSNLFPSMQGKDGFNFVEPMYFHDSKYFLDRLAAGDSDTWSLEQGITNLRLIWPLVYG